MADNDCVHTAKGGASAACYRCSTEVSLQPFIGISTCCATHFKVTEPQLASQKPCNGAQLHADRCSTTRKCKHSVQAGLTCFSQHLSTLTRQLHMSVCQFAPSHCDPASSSQAQVQVHCSSLPAVQPISAWQITLSCCAPPAGWCPLSQVGTGSQPLPLIRIRPAMYML